MERTAQVMLAWALLLSQAATGRAEAQCAVYTPKSCLFGPKVLMDNAKCHPQGCEFDVAQTFGQCGFPETGEYSLAPAGADGCTDPFMLMHRAGPEPCGERCCRGDHYGDFTPQGTIPGNGGEQFEFQPTDGSCRYAAITRGQLLHYLRLRGATVMVAGDSMLRQFYLRLVMMMRGQERLLDYHIHAHAQYAVCGEADIFRVSANAANVSTIVPNNEYLKSKIKPFFRGEHGPGRVAGGAALTRCSRRPVEFHYLHAPRFKNQISSVPRYFEAIQPGTKAVVLTSVGYWESGAEVPQEYLDMLRALRERALKVFVISVPTIRVIDEERADNYRVRNTFMRAWVEEQGEPYTFLDYDKLSLSEHMPPGGSDNNWHYMCSVAWRIACSTCELAQIDHSSGGGEDGLTPVPQIPVGDVERIHATEDGLCSDEVNRSLWQIVFNMLLKPVSEGDSDRRRRRRAAA